MDEVLAGIGGGDIRINQLVNFLQSKFNKATAEEEDRAAMKTLESKSSLPRAPSHGSGQWWLKGW